jgi:PLP dependent protein
MAGQRGALARAGGPGHQHQAARLERQVGKDLGRSELLQRQDLARDGAEHRAGAAVLVEGVDAEARQALDLEAEVALQRVLVVLALGVVHDVVHHGVHLLVVQRLDVDAPHVAVHADHRRQAGRQVQVGGLVLDRKGQQLGDVHGWRAGPRRAKLGGLWEHRSQPATSAGASHAAAAAGRPEQSVTLLAVSKTFPADSVRRAHAAGQRAFGENYVQEALDKIEALADLRARIEWHLIGPLQSNKTRRGRAFDWVHSVDRLKIAQRLAEQRPPGLPPLQLCLQVNISGEASKSGCGPATCRRWRRPWRRCRRARASARADGDSRAGRGRAAQRAPHRALRELLAR